jgi:hypothetical protein
VTKDEALDLALEALKEYCEHGAIFMPLTAVEALEEALAAPVQEPVAEIQEDMKGGGYVKWLSEDFFVAGTKLYTTPPAAQPAVPDALNPKDENPAYAAGWNDCRQAMMEMMK